MEFGFSICGERYCLHIFLTEISGSFRKNDGKGSIDRITACRSEFFHSGRVGLLSEDNACGKLEVSKSIHVPAESRGGEVTEQGIAVSPGSGRASPYLSPSSAINFA
jgi:hypothetical protein